MGVEVKGLDKLRSKMNKVSAAAKKGTENAIYEMTQEVAGQAASNLASSVKHASGELVGSIKDEVETDTNGNLVGRVWTDKKQGMFREFGTGPKGEASAKDLPPGITPVYTQRAWFFLVDWVEEDLTEIYGIPRVQGKDIEFYMTTGQPARPWLYPALKDIEARSDDILKRNIQSAIKKGLK